MTSQFGTGFQTQLSANKNRSENAHKGTKPIQKQPLTRNSAIPLSPNGFPFSEAIFRISLYIPYCRQGEASVSREFPEKICAAPNFPT
jgi:hypothetical protein